ncbi:hypothetical protein L7F22_028328 [Adiantum nelumboides]|nr:hypothetical protein [Adiantum nelumboides]
MASLANCVAASHLVAKEKLVRTSTKSTFWGSQLHGHGQNAVRIVNKVSKSHPIATSIRANTVVASVETLKPASGKKTVTKSYCAIMRASSGLGLATATALTESGEWHVVMAC